MKIDGMGSLSDFVGDFIVYRGLQPADPRLPGFADLRARLRLDAPFAPRKNEPEYARVMVEILRRAHALTSRADIRRVVFLGDTRLLDSTAFANICAAGGWQGIAFIGAENGQPPATQVEALPGGQTLFLSNRWPTWMTPFHSFCKQTTSCLMNTPPC
jgi:hypothetical protein